MRPSASTFFFFPVWWCGVAFLLTQGALIAGISITPVLWGIAWLGAIGTTTLLGASRRHALLTGTLWLLAWLALSWLATLITDFSWDGQAYHQEAILRLAQGWNPTHALLTTADTPHTSWINPYPKASWYLGALTFESTGHIESAKAPAWLLGIATAGLAAIWATRLPMPRAARWSIWLAWCLNPVIACQWATFQVDGLVAVCLSGVLFCGLGILLVKNAPWTRAQSTAGLGIWLVLLASLKFTGLVFGVYAVLCIAALFWLRRSQLAPYSRRGVAFLVLFLLLAVPITVYNPYGQNIQRYGHPFWPVMGPNAENVIGFQEHPQFMAQNRLVKFFWANNAISRSVAGFQSVDDAKKYGIPKWKPPFVVYPRELRVYISPDVHIGGFGPLYGGILWLTLPLLVVGVVRRWSGAREITLIWVLVAGSVLINPESWWARYSPQAWWLVLLPLISAFQSGKRARITGAVVLVLIGLDALLVLGVNAAGQGLCELGMRKQMRLLAAHPNNWEIAWGLARTNRERFHEWHVPVTVHAPTTTGTDWHPAKLIRTDATIYSRDTNLTNELEKALPIH